MIRRPLNERFADKVLAGIKTTTIRDNPWPVGKPIMLFRWSGKPYRSKQVEVAPVIVEDACQIRIFNDHLGITYAKRIQTGRPLYESEGFESREEMDSWFRPLVPQNGEVTKALMRFRLYIPPTP